MIPRTRPLEDRRARTPRRRRRRNICRTRTRLRHHHATRGGYIRHRRLRSGNNRLRSGRHDWLGHRRRHGRCWRHCCMGNCGWLDDHRLRRRCRGNRRGRSHDWRFGDYRPGDRTARDSGRHNIVRRCRARNRNDTPWRRGRRWRCRHGRCNVCGSDRRSWRGRRLCCHRGTIHRGGHRNRRPGRGRHPGRILSLLALQDGLQRISRLGDMRQIELGLGLGSGRTRRSTARPTAEVAAHLLSFILFDGAGMRLLLGDANRRQSIQNGSALDL